MKTIISKQYHNFITTKQKEQQKFSVLEAKMEKHVKMVHEKDLAK